MGLQPGLLLELEVTDGRLLVEVAPIDIRLEKRRHGPVAVADEPLPTLTADVGDTLSNARAGDAGRHEHRGGGLRLMTPSTLTADRVVDGKTRVVAAQTYERYWSHVPANRLTNACWKCFAGIAGAARVANITGSARL